MPIDLWVSGREVARLGQPLTSANARSRSPHGSSALTVGAVSADTVLTWNCIIGGQS
jgi:hypothetical protein